MEFREKAILWAKPCHYANLYGRGEELWLNDAYVNTIAAVEACRQCEHNHGYCIHHLGLQDMPVRAIRVTLEKP